MSRTVTNTVTGVVFGLFALVIIAGVLHRPGDPRANPAFTSAMPAYCANISAERLPECGWTESREKATVQPSREERQKLTESEAEEMARIFMNCMRTDKTQEQCAKQAGVPLSALSAR